ncbi:MAG: hypothetical protein EXQ57_01285 [Bryobacterales bacterium]|nr:hypothetical protein [Bryobacterales bacterium]
MLSSILTRVRWAITFYAIKADRIGDYLAAVKEIAALRAKASSARYSAPWASLSGPREYALVTYRSKWAGRRLMTST